MAIIYFIYIINILYIIYIYIYICRYIIYITYILYIYIYNIINTHTLYCIYGKSDIEQSDQIIPTLWGFHIEYAFINCINKKFVGSGVPNIDVSAGFVVDKSADQAIRSKHYIRFVSRLQLTYEAVYCKLEEHEVQEAIKLSANRKGKQSLQYHIIYEETPVEHD